MDDAFHDAKFLAMLPADGYRLLHIDDYEIFDEEPLLGFAVFLHDGGESTTHPVTVRGIVGFYTYGHVAVLFPNDRVEAYGEDMSFATLQEFRDHLARRKQQRAATPKPGAREGCQVGGSGTLSHTS
jgi:hypothetical protein